MYRPIYGAIKDFFAECQWAGARIPVVFAAPDRAHAEMTRITLRRQQGQGRVTKQQVEEGQAPRPFMSVYMQPLNFDADRFSPARIRGFNVNKQTGTAQIMKYPEPVSSDIQVDLWCGDKGGEKIAQSIEPQVSLRFQAESAYLPVDWSLAKWYKKPFEIFEHARVYGKTRIRLVREGGWSDNSDIEFGEGSKEIRRTWSGKMEAYIPHMPEEARIVLKIGYEVFDGFPVENPALIESRVISAED